MYSWNVNGIRSVAQKGFLQWMETARPDVVALQETKAFVEQLEPGLRNPKGYHSFFCCAEKPGYSGVAIYTREEPVRIMEGLRIPDFDREGRVLVAEFKDYMVANAYFPNSQRDHARLPYKLAFCDAMMDWTQSLRKKGKNVILCGDFNIAHKEIDLKNPKTNKDNAGFLPEERAWMDKYLGAGYIDTFRKFHPEKKDRYSWWSYRPGVRAKNIGWRLDYFVTNPELQDRLVDADIHDAVTGSDHCPVSLTLRR